MELYIIDDYAQCHPDLTGKALTEEILKDLLLENGYVTGMDREGIRIRRQSGGKPVLDGDLVFSVSHTGSCFGCVIASRGESDALGLDLQRARPGKLQRLARRYFTEEENRYLQEVLPAVGGADPSGEKEYRARFYRLWTRKEAFAKYTGKGLAQILEKTGVLDRTDVQFLDIDFGDGLFGCICSCSDTQEERRNGIQISR